MSSNSIVTAYSPPFSLIKKYFIAGILSFLLFTFLLALNYNDIDGLHFQAKILSVTHIATLGWITMIIFGAMFQLVPVVLEVELFSEKLAEVTFWIFVAGIIGMVESFWRFRTGWSMVAFAILLNLAFFLFSINIIVSMLKVKKWNLTALYLASSIFYLVVTAIAGLLLAINLGFPYIKLSHLQYLNLHAHTALIGWVLMVIMGVSYKLIPMFSLSHGYKMLNAKVAFVLINIGLLGINTIMHYKNHELLSSVFGIIIGIGICFYMVQIYLILKNRLRKKSDISFKFTYSSFAFLIISMVFGIVLSLTKIAELRNMTILYGFMILVGFISMLIVGQMYKIVPFLVWYHKFSGKVGKEKVPMLKDLFDEKIAYAGFYIMLAGVIGSIISFLFYVKILLMFSFVILFISAIIFVFNMYKIFGAK